MLATTRISPRMIVARRGLLVENEGGISASPGERRLKKYFSGISVQNPERSRGGVPGGDLVRNLLQRAAE